MWDFVEHRSKIYQYFASEVMSVLYENSEEWFAPGLFKKFNDDSR